MTQNDLVLVTGASGWLGRRVVRALIQGNPEMGPFGAGGRRVRMLVRPGEKVDDLLALGAEKVEGDLRDPAAARSLTVGAAGATLIHLAGVIHPTTARASSRSQRRRHQSCRYGGRQGRRAPCGRDVLQFTDRREP